MILIRGRYDSVSTLFIYFLTSLLEYNCFTMVCWFLLFNRVNQLYIYIYPHISSLLRFPPTQLYLKGATKTYRNVLLRL